MSIMDELAAVPSRHYPCIVATVVAQHPADADDIRTAVDSDYSASVVATVLARRGIHLKPAAISKHRRGSCSCKRS